LNVSASSVEQSTASDGAVFDWTADQMPTVATTARTAELATTTRHLDATEDITKSPCSAPHEHQGALLRKS
jgi:hypothetical protein